MDAISYSYADKQAKRIKKFIENPDSNSGIVTVPKVIGAGESVTIPAGRMAVLPNIQVDGTLNVEGEVFIPSGSTFGDLEDQLATKADTTYVNGKYSGFKNYIINGNFDIWQRGNSFSSISDSFLIADRWWLDWMGVATGLSASKQPGFTRKNSLYIQRTGGASMQMYQMVENQGNLSNKTFTFSALVKSTTDGTVNFFIADGRSGTNFAYAQSPVTLEANKPKKIVFTVQLGQVSANALCIALRTTCIGLYVEAVQMEEGNVATPFEQRPIGLELSLCQRYYEVFRYQMLGNPTGAGQYFSCPIIYNVAKRTVPTLINAPDYNTLAATYTVYVNQPNGGSHYVTSAGAGLLDYRGSVSASAEL